MGGVVDALVDLAKDIVDAVVDAVILVWKEVAVPILEEVFSWFGIEDEMVVSVSKVSVPLLSDETRDIVKIANIKTVMGMARNNGGFLPNYMYNISQAKVELQTFFNYGKGPYVHGLPTMTVKGGNMDYAAIDSAINTDLGGSFTVLTVFTTFPKADLWCKNELQDSPTNYLPYANTLTYDDDYSVSYSDWSYISEEFNFGMNRYDVTIQRTAERTLFWILADGVILEGDTGSFTINCNRSVPAGESITVNLTYTGATNGVDFTAPTSVVIPASANSASVDITGISVSALTSLDIGISVDNSSAVFEYVELLTPFDSAEVLLVPTDGIIVTMPAITATESTTAIIPVTLQNAAAGAFTLDFETIDDLTAIPGSDYTVTSGTLNFAGTAGEIQNIEVDISGDIYDDSYDEFGIRFTACSDGSVNISNTTKVKIIDGAGLNPVADTVNVQKLVPIPNYVKERYMVVTYHESSQSSSDWFYWLYRLDDNTYPINPQSSQISNLDMLPVGILRKDKQFVNEDYDLANDKLEPFGVDSEYYKTTRNLLKRVRMNIDDIIANIAENPDIDSVDDAYINFSMNPADESKVLSKLLWLHFYEIIEVHGLTSNNNEYSVSFEEQDVNNAAVWTDQEFIYNNYPFAPPEDAARLSLMEYGEYDHYIKDESDLVMLYKFNSTIYGRITINNLSGMSAIEYDGYHKMNFNKLGDEGFNLPVSWAVIKKMKPKEMLQVYPYLLRIDLYSIQVTEIAWYMTSAFKVLFQIVMVVLTIITLGAATSFLAAVGQLLFNYAIVQLVVFVAKLTGNEEFAAIVGIVAAVVIGNAAGFNFDVGTIDGLANVVTNFTNSMATAQSIEMKELNKDLTALLEDYDELKEKIDDAEKTSSVLNIYDYNDITGAETRLYMAGRVQYDFDSVFDYGRIIDSFYHSKLNTVTI